jgi:hypothetical protein
LLVAHLCEQKQQEQRRQECADDQQGTRPHRPIDNESAPVPL